MRVVTYSEPEVPSELRAQATALREQAWPGLGDSPHDRALNPVVMLLVSPEGEVTAALDILSKDLEHGGRAYRAAGLSAVATAEAHRGKGNGRQLVAAARAAIAQSGADVGLFTCDRPLRDFYESAGWSVLQDTVLVGGTPQEPFPSDQPGFDKVTMAGFFTERARRHADAFPGSRIGLYPGEIDRLW
ncbi:GNAT family N-acetyltransferase [Streptomyces sp. NPDC053079]|uniref:GNAT family N-acetyltransferase n=1 Tax=Streptomyces sp. NPDC053079 TaxID=3365697 RepID=UPI0037D2A851